MSFWNVADAFFVLWFTAALCGVIGFAIDARIHFVREGWEYIPGPIKGVAAVWNMMFCVLALAVPAAYAALRGSSVHAEACGVFWVCVFAWLAMVLYGDKNLPKNTSS